MAAIKKNGEGRKPKRPPATTPEARENQLISLAVDLAEQQLAAGTASSQVITHYLKLATTRERLEQEKLARENELLKAKQAGLESAQRIDELYSQAIEAMRSYSGHAVAEDEEYDDD